MSIQLSSAVEDKVSELMETWKYPDASSLVERALELLNDHEKLVSLRIKLQHAQDQVDRGETTRYSEALHDEIWADAVQRHAAGERARSDV